MSPADAARDRRADAPRRLDRGGGRASRSTRSAPTPVERGDVTVVPGEESPFDGFPFEDGPAVAVSVHYVDGVTGGNVLLMTARGARAIAAAMGDAERAPTTQRRRARASWSCPPSPRPPTRCSPPPRARPASCSARTVEIAPPDTRLLDARRRRARGVRRDAARRQRDASASAASRAGSCSSSPTRSSCA